MYPGRADLLTFAHEATMMMLSYNVKKLEAYEYLTNKRHLMNCSYELQCCIFDQDPIEYIRVCDRAQKDMVCQRR
jgi:hypothetical protein